MPTLILVSMGHGLNSRGRDVDVLHLTDFVKHGEQPVRSKNPATPVVFDKCRMLVKTPESRPRMISTW